MKSIGFAIPVLAALVSAPALAATPKVLGTDLRSFSVLADTYVSTGDSATVYGNVLSGTYGTTGANSNIYGNFQTNTVATTGANALVKGNLQSTLAGTLGADSTVTGDFQTGAVGTMGAGALVNGNYVTGLAGTVGANAQVVGNFDVGGVRALGASATIGGTRGTTSLATTTDLTQALAGSLASAKTQLDAEKVTLSAMGTGTALAATMPTSTTFNAGVYSAASWTTTASTTLYLDGQNKANQTWVFNITDILSTGASSKIELINAGANSQIFWNTGGYASLGADSTFLGTVLATTYISVGANAVVSNLAGSACGGLFSSTSYVSIGAGARVGSGGCSAIASITSAVPESQSYAMLLAGLGLIGTITRRRSKKAA
jgi:hypothetical protein